MRLNDLYLTFKREFTSKRFENPNLEAKSLIQSVLNLNNTDFILKSDKNLSKEDIDNADRALKRRLAGEPLSKILGIKEFWGLEFTVNEHVLDPRPDTETLIEAVLDYVDNKDVPIKILDLGTGTGCIPIALLSEFPNAVAFAVDKSADALSIAAQNAANHKMSNRITFIESDWYGGIPHQQFDIIVSNPPYIVESDIAILSKEVKNHDPHMALFGGESGLECYKNIFYSLNKFLIPDGRAFFEIGANQLNDIMRLVDESNLLYCESRADLVGIPRVVEICCGDK